MILPDRSLPEIAAIAREPLADALALARRKFDVDEIATREILLADVAEYYRQADPGYRRFHSHLGSRHIALGVNERGEPDFSLHPALFREQLATITGPAETGRAIEFGCGPGYNLHWLAERDAERRWVGVDLSSVHLAQARERSKQSTNVRWIETDYRRVDEPTASFDGVFAVETLCQTNDLPAALAEAQRLLRPGGRLVVIDCFRRRPLAELSDDLRMAALLVEKATAVNGFTVFADWQALCREAGFTEVLAEDRSADTRADLARLYGLAHRFFTTPLVDKLAKWTFGPRLVENSLTGLMMPYSVGLGAHVYAVSVWEK